MTVINWERIGKVAGKGFLFFLEYCIKLCAFVVTGVVLATNGSFGTKLGAGFTSISPTLRGFFETAGEVSGIATMIHDFNIMSANAFNAKHGVNAVDNVFAFLDGGIVYVQTVMSNFGSQPFSTFFAAFLSFGSLFIISLVLRFARQKGQGSYYNKLERKLSERIYASSKKRTKPAPETNSATNSSSISTKSRASRTRSKFKSSKAPASSPGSISSSSGINTHSNGHSVPASNGKSRTAGKKAQTPNSFREAQKTNKHLENYINSVKNG